MFPLKNSKTKDLQPGDQNKKSWRFLAALFILAGLIVIAGAGLIGFEIAYANKFYPGVKINGQKVGGMTKEQLSPKLLEKEEIIKNQGLKFRVVENGSVTKEFSLDLLSVSAEDPDLSKALLSYEWQATIDSAYNTGRTGNFLSRLLNQGKSLFFGWDHPIIYTLDEVGVYLALQKNFAEFEKQPQNAVLTVNEDKTISVSEDQPGYTFNYEESVKKLKANLGRLDFIPIDLDLNYTEAEIKKNQGDASLSEISDWTRVQKIKLTVKENSWELLPKDYFTWIELQKINEEIVIGLNREKIQEFIKPITDQVNVPAQDAVFKLENEKVIDFTPSRDGLEIDQEQSIQKITEQIKNGDEADLELPFKTTPSKVATRELNDLGITELIGRGTSNFAGSPVNRRHNIAVGAKTLNGILIKPGEEFSVIKALGAIDGEHGYRQELVIKGDRTIPEYGGGLCQIGTTAFRVALYSGLPITQRRNHSYRVVYYEPAGMDATIYDPMPDLRFINDTGNHILFATRIEGNNLIFEFYGTKDGRKFEINPDPPKIYNVSRPGAPRYIETEDLKPGEKKQIEKPHNGADTYFKYIITYADGRLVEKEFASHYVAWPEIWLIGKEPTVATSTEATTETAPSDSTVTN